MAAMKPSQALKSFPSEAPVTPESELDSEDEDDYDDYDDEEWDDLDNQSGEILILSDSIWRHVGVSCPKRRMKGRASPPIIKKFELEGRNFTKHVIPGACSDRLWHEAARVARDDPTPYEEVIIHCGTNFATSRVAPPDAELELKHLIRNVSALFPDARITFSRILPRFCEDDDAPWWNNYTIEYMNNNIERFCELEGFGFFDVIDLEVDNAQRMLAIDGIHLGHQGIQAMTRALGVYIKYTHKW